MVFRPVFLSYKYGFRAFEWIFENPSYTSLYHFPKKVSWHGSGFKRHWAIGSRPTLLLAWHVVCLISKLKCAPEHSRRCEWSRHNQVCTSLTGRHMYSVAKLSLVRPTGTKADRLWLTPCSFISDFSSQDCVPELTPPVWWPTDTISQNSHDITIGYTYFVCNRTAE